MPEVTPERCVLVIDKKEGSRYRILEADGTTRISVIPGYNWNVGNLLFCDQGADGELTVFGQGQATTVGYDKKTKTFGGMATAEDCVLFAECTTAATGNSGARYTAYLLRDLTSIPAQNAAYITDGNNQVVAVYMDLNKPPVELHSGMIYGIVTAYNGVVKVDGKTYYEYDVGCNDEIYSIFLDGTKNSLKKGQLVSFMERADGCYAPEDITVYTEKNIQTAWVKEYNTSDNIITIYTALTEYPEGYYEGSQATTYAVAENPHIIYVNARDNTVGEDIGINPLDSITGYKNAAFLLNEKNRVVVIFVETSGKCDILP